MRVKVKVILPMFLNHLREIWHVPSKRHEIQQEQSPDVDLQGPRRGERDHRMHYLMPLLDDCGLSFDCDLRMSCLRLNCQRSRYLHSQMKRQQN